MGASRWTEAPKPAGPLEQIAPFEQGGLRFSRALPWDPGGGWDNDDGKTADTFAVNLALPRVRVLWGLTVDIGPDTGRLTTVRTGDRSRDRIPGMFFAGERILIPVPDVGGRFDVQTWGATPGIASGSSGHTGPEVWEWGRVNAAGNPAVVPVTVPALIAAPPPPPPPSTDIPAAIDKLRKALGHLHKAKETYAQAAGRGPRSLARTHPGMCEQAILDAVEALGGRDSA